MKKIILSLALIMLFSNGVNAAVVNGATINGGSVTGENTLVEGGTHNGENIQNEDCLKYPEKCQAEIPNITTGTPNIQIPNLNMGQNSNTEESSYVNKIKILPVTGPKEIMLILLALLVTGGLLFVLKSKNKA